MLPADSLLGVDQGVVLCWVVGEFFERQISVVKVGLYPGEEDVHKFWVGFDCFCLGADGFETGGLPAAVGDGLALEQVVVTFFVVATGRAARVIPGRLSEEGFPGWK
jgi:hypothetical protein